MCASVCSGCTNSIRKVLRMTDDEVFTFLRRHNVILSSKSCPQCKNLCTLSSDLFWRCQRKRKIVESKKKIEIKCNFKQSIRANTFFDNSHISIREIFDFIILTCTLNSPKTVFLENEFSWSRNTIIDWNNFIREVYIDWAIENSVDKLGGEGKIVEIDEAKMGKRKYNKGRIIEGQWIFGGIERESKNIFMIAVPDRTKETLLQIIKEKILPGSTIVSDCWTAYNCLSDENYKHLTVNHSYNFIDPDTGAHTQNIERTWREVRSNIPRYGRIGEHFAGYLAEFFFRRQYPNNINKIHEIFKAIGKLYNPNK